jgi:hypothetical protein
MELYNQVLADQMVGKSRRMIQGTPQPTMFGGRRVRKYVLAGTSESDYPSSLSVGSLTGEHPSNLAGAYFGDGMSHSYSGGMIYNPVQHGFHGVSGVYGAHPMMEQGGKIHWGRVAKKVGKVALPIAKDMAIDALENYMSGSSAPEGGKIHFGKVAKSVGKVALPIAKKMAKKAFDDYMEGQHEQAEGGKIHWGKVAKKVGKVALPIAKDMAIDAFENYMSGSSAPPAGGKINFGKIAKKVGKVALPVGKEVVRVTLPYAKKMAKDAFEDYMSSAPAQGGRIASPQAYAKYLALHHPTQGGKIHWGKIAKKVGKVALPIAKDMAIDAFENYMSGSSAPPAGGKVHIGRAFKKVGRAVGRVGATIAPYALPIAFDALATASGNPELAPLGQALGQSTGDALAKKYGYGAGMKPRGRPRKNGGALLMNHPEQFHHSVYPPALQSYSGKFKGAGVKRVSARGAIVSQVMKQHGMSLPQASAFVKQNGLY